MTVYTGTCVANADTRLHTRRFLPHVFKLNHVTPSWSSYNGNDDGKRDPWTLSFNATRSWEKHEHDFTSRMTMHTLDRRDNLQDSATAFAANNSFWKL